MQKKSDRYQKADILIEAIDTNTTIISRMSMHNPLKILIALLFFFSLGITSELFSQQDSLYKKELYMKEKSHSTVSEDTELGIINIDDAIAINMAEVRQLIEYPAEAIDLGLQSRVVARLLINEKGDYVRHIIIRGDYPIFVKEVEKHLSKLRFSPTIINGKATYFWVNVHFGFILEKGGLFKRRKKSGR